MQNGHLAVAGEAESATAEWPFIRYNFDEHDIVAAGRLVFEIDPRIRNGILKIDLCVLFVVTSILGIALWLKNFERNIAITAAVVLVSVVVRLYTGRHSTRDKATGKLRKKAADGGFREAVGEYEIGTNDKGIVIRHKTIEKRVEWSAIVRAFELFDCLVIFVDPKSAQFIPHRSLCGGDYDAFVRILESRVPFQRKKTRESFEAARSA